MYRHGIILSTCLIYYMNAFKYKENVFICITIYYL